MARSTRLLKQLAEHAPRHSARFHSAGISANRRALTCGFQTWRRASNVLTLDACTFRTTRQTCERWYEHPADARSMLTMARRVAKGTGADSSLESDLLEDLSTCSSRARSSAGRSRIYANSGSKLYKADVVAKELQLYGGMHRFIPLIAKELGYRVTEVPVTHHERKHGTSKYRSTKS